VDEDVLAIDVVVGGGVDKEVPAVDVEGVDKEVLAIEGVDEEVLAVEGVDKEVLAVQSHCQR